MHYRCIESIFNGLFVSAYQTELRGGALEPFYQVAEPISVIHYSHDYESSALHEVAHWCIAGAERRRQDDYGYWYEGNRDVSKQERFEIVEARPQALEWIFSQAAGLPFRVSIDNLALDGYDADHFRAAVQRRVQQELKQGLGKRALMFAGGLAKRANTSSYDKLEVYANLPN